MTAYTRLPRPFPVQCWRCGTVLYAQLDLRAGEPLSWSVPEHDEPDPGPELRGYLAPQPHPRRCRVSGAEL